jgi:NCAIR mutase (PurE)-related protein
LPALDEALAVAREMGVSTKSFPDVGVAGIHRLIEPLRELEAFDPDCLIVAAGMEGALPSVVSGLVSVPVIGLPTSTGYGLGGDGTAAILGMLQTCSPGLSVVNIDNGVGAGATAALIANRAAAARAHGNGLNSD